MTTSNVGINRLYLQFGQTHYLKTTPVDAGNVIEGLTITVAARRDDGKWFNWAEYESNPSSANIWISSPSSSESDFKKTLTETKLFGDTHLYAASFNYPENIEDDTEKLPVVIQFFFSEDSVLGGVFYTEEVMWRSRKMSLDLYSITPIGEQDLVVVSG